MVTVPFGPVAVPLGHVTKPLPTVLHVPLKIDRDQWTYVRATVNGHTGWFLLDTGAPTLLLYEGRVPLGPAVDSTSLGGMAGDSSIVHIYHGITLKWGGMTRRDVGAVGVENVERRELGVIGLGQLAPFTTVFDYPEKQLVLYRNDTDGNPPAMMPPPAVTIPLRWTADDGLFVPVTIGGQTVDLILDTGSNQDAITTAVVKRAGVHIQPTEFRGVSTDSVSGPKGTWLPMTYSRIDQLWLGPIAYDTLVTQVWDMAAAGHPIAGFLGYDFFVRRRVGINLQKMVLYLWGEPKV